jgi:hypothetical protein
LAEDLGLNKLIISTDFSEVVTMIREESKCGYSAILHEIKVKSSSFKVMSIIFEGRDTNGDAHFSC